MFAFLIFISEGKLLIAQHSPKSLTKDSTDGAFDVSDYIIQANGFVPVPILITEPALGGFGGGIVPVFIKRRPPYVDSVNGRIVHTPIAPDITGGAGLYTLNNTWLAAAFRSGTFIKSRIKYIAGGGFFNLNISFYRTLEHVGEKEFKVNIKSVPVILQAIKRIKMSHWYAGLRFFFLASEVRFAGDSALSHQFVKQSELKSIVSQVGTLVELDNRDNIFTPNSGIKFHIDAMVSDDFIGSDYNYWQMNSYVYLYKQFGNLVPGLRIDIRQAFGDPPFFLLPYIDLRGVPIAKYQGKTDMLAEGELRWDFVSRWSLVFFGGTGTAFDQWNEFDSSKWIATVGSGFRYMLARKFKLRVGLDFAKGPGTWAYYIVFGSNWGK